MDVLSLVAPLALTAAVCWVGIRRTRVEPRRLSNAYWLLVGVLLAFQTLANLAVPGIAGLVTTVIAAPSSALCLALFLILNGAWMLRTDGAWVASLVSVVAGIGLLALVGCIVPVLVSGGGRLAEGLVVVLLAAGYLGFQFVAFLGYTLVYPRLVPARPVDWLVVFGFGEGVDIGPLVASRIRTGLVECARHGSRFLVMSSGREMTHSGIEADAMADWAIAEGADPGVLVRETRSHDIEEGLRYSASLMSAHGAGDGLVVTSNYQVLRVAILARRTRVAAHAVGAPTLSYYWPSAILREFVAVLAEHKITHVVLIMVILLSAPILVA